MQFASKRFWVTAAAAGIGRACALRLAAGGAHVYASDIDEFGLASLPPEIERFQLDATDRPAMEAAGARLGRLDGVVHCVGFVHEGTILHCPPEAWTKSFDVNVNSFYNLLVAVLPEMLAARAGSIVCIASVASSLRGLPARAAYGASKAALIGLIKSLAIDYAEHGIRANAVCPGTIMSPSLLARAQAASDDRDDASSALARFASRQPMGRLGEPEEVAALCAYLLSDESRFVTGQAWAIDGGMTI